MAFSSGIYCNILYLSSNSTVKNYCDNNIDLCIDFGGFTETFSLAKVLFQSKFRNCMMHYGLENQEVISIENIQKPFYGIVETCYNGMDYYSFWTH